MYVRAHKGAGIYLHVLDPDMILFLKLISIIAFPFRRAFSELDSALIGKDANQEEYIYVCVYMYVYVYVV